MALVIGTAVLSQSDDGVDEVTFQPSADFMEMSLIERLGAAYLLVSEIYDLIDYEDDIDPEDEDLEDDEDEDDDWSEEEYA
jgi:hypothetical protein